MLIETPMSTKEMAHVCGVTEGTAKAYLARIYRKLGAAKGCRVVLMHREIQRLLEKIETLTDGNEVN